MLALFWPDPAFESDGADPSSPAAKTVSLLLLLSNFRACDFLPSDSVSTSTLTNSFFVALSPIS